VNAVLSGATATAAVPRGHPDPLTVTTSMTICWVGGAGSGSITIGTLRSDATMLPIATRLSM
jgi:hypothetical protein